MKKFINITTFVVLLCMLATMACGCSGKSSEEETTTEPVVAVEETTAEATTEAATEATTEATTEAATEETLAPLTDEMVFDAIHNYCVIENPENASLDADSWEIVSSDDSQVVVLFRAYTGAEIRYYVDRVTGDTYVTEFVSGIMDEEQMSDVTLNAREHIALEIYG